MRSPQNYRFNSNEVVVSFQGIVVFLTLFFSTSINCSMLLIFDEWMDLPETVDLKLVVWV